MLDMLDYRRRTAEMYRLVREWGTDSARAYTSFRLERDDLFRTHPQSPLDHAQKLTFQGLRYYDYDAAFRVVASVDGAVEPITYDLDLGDDGSCTIRQFGKVTVDLPTGSGTLYLFWITGYGDGVFLPFCDATNGRQTFGGGRYLYDTIKGADLGAIGDVIVLDFNYAYHPSCHYSPRWVCPLAPPQNTLDIPVPVGEMKWKN